MESRRSDVILAASQAVSSIPGAAESFLEFYAGR